MYALEEPPQVLRIHTRRDPVSQICDPRFRFAVHFKAFTHALHRLLDRIAPTVEQTWVHVALKGRLPFRDASGFGRVDAPVKTEDVIPRRRCHRVQRLVGTLGEERHRDGRDVEECEAGPNRCGYMREIREGERRKVVWGELGRPGVKDLEKLEIGRVEDGTTRDADSGTYLRASFDLPDQKVHTYIGDALQERFGFLGVLEQPSFGKLESLASPSLNHVCHERPWRTAEANQWHLSFQLVPGACESLEHIAQLLVNVNRGG